VKLKGPKILEKIFKAKFIKKLWHILLLKKKKKDHQFSSLSISIPLFNLLQKIKSEFVFHNIDDPPHVGTFFL
jgi:hypothetical protein